MKLSNETHNVYKILSWFMCSYLKLTACPGDVALTNGLKEVQEAKAKTEAQQSSPFGNIMGKLMGHPKFGEWMSDPVMMSKIQALQSNPNAALQSAIGDPSMHPVLEAALGIKLGNPSDFGGESSGPGPASASQPASEPEPVKPKELSEEEKEAAKVTEVRTQGNNHYKKKEFSEALACYDKVLEMDPTQVSVLNNKIAVYMEMGDLDVAETEANLAVEKARSQRPTPFDVIAKIFVRCGKIKMKRKDVAGALECYAKAQMEFHTKDVERLIKTTQLEKKKQDALDYINPDLANEAKERGNDAFRAQEWGKAIAEYEDAVKRNPKDPSIQNNLSATLCKVMDFQGAKRAVEKALDLDPKYVKAWARKGDIEFLQKEFHKAMESYQKGLNLEAGNKLCREGLNKTMSQINSSTGKEVDKERAAHAMADPEIQMILSDPMVRQVLQDLSTSDPVAQAAGQKAMRDPIMGGKIQKLIAAGVLQTS
mmetsp:Transcript_42571/g.54739  ORF Transcript_42571/g.54739 Transcript_42571/m.54739 type:complete len:482 (+) Transcript_42571:568-2013(+)